MGSTGTYVAVGLFSILALGGFAAAFGAFGSDQKNAAANNAASLTRQRAQMEPVNTTASYPPIVSAVPAGGKGKKKASDETINLVAAEKNNEL